MPLHLPSLALGLGAGFALGVALHMLVGRRTLRGMHRLLQRLGRWL